MRSSLRTERFHNFCTEILISNVLIWRLSPHIFKFLATSSKTGLAFTWSWWLVEFAGFEAVLVVAVLVGILDLQDNENEKVAKRVIQDMLNYITIGMAHSTLSPDMLKYSIIDLTIWATQFKSWSESLPFQAISLIAKENYKSAYTHGEVKLTQSTEHKSSTVHLALFNLTHFP